MNCRVNDLKKIPGSAEIRKIIHIDMDAFFAAVEQRDNPGLRGKPVIVGGAPDRRGVVAACSYEARRFGIHSAMPSARALRLCPDAVFLRPRFEVYREVSLRIQDIFRRFTDLIEPLSLDEAYLDVTGSNRFAGSAVKLAREIKRCIKQETALTASAGVSYNKFLAKIASDMDKPDGLYVILPEQGEAFVAQLRIGRFHGIGKSTEARMQGLGIHTGADLKRMSREDLLRHFGKAGNYFYHIARGIDHRPVNPDRIRKSIGSEITLMQDLDDPGLIVQKLHEQAGKVIGILNAKALLARTLTIKIKYTDFRQITRSQSLREGFDQLIQVAPLLPELLAKTDAGKQKVRLLGVSVSNLMPVTGKQKEEQLDLILQD